MKRATKICLLLCFTVLSTLAVSTVNAVEPLSIERDYELVDSKSVHLIIPSEAAEAWITIESYNAMNPDYELPDILYIEGKISKIPPGVSYLWHEVIQTGWKEENSTEWLSRPDDSKIHRENDKCICVETYIGTYGDFKYRFSFYPLTGYDIPNGYYDVQLELCYWGPGGSGSDMEQISIYAK